MMGWDVDFLQSAVDTCTNLSGEISDCPLFSLQPDSSATTCSFPVPSALQTDDCAGPRSGLCGDLAVQSGPAYATKGPAGGAAPTPAPASNTPGPAATSSIPGAASLLPTSLGYSQGHSVATDNSGGGITIAAVPVNAKAPQAAATYVPPAPQAPQVQVAAAPSSSSSTPEPTPTITPSPQLPTSSSSHPPFVSTSTWTSGGVAYELYIEEVDVSTTVTVDAPAKAKRHVHHRRGPRGGLGRGEHFHG